MRGAPPERSLVLQCKGCQRFVPPGVDAAPTEAIVATCPLCGERRRYRPTEVFLGLLDMEARRKPAISAQPKHLQYRRKA